MKRKPRRLLKARRLSKQAAYVGPEWTGPQPAYLAKVQALTTQLAGTLTPGTVSVIEVAHDDGCPGLDGGCCDCDPEVRFRPANPD